MTSTPHLDRRAQFHVRRCQDLLQRLRDRAADLNGEMLRVVEGDIQAVTDELLSLEYCGQLRSNTLSLLSKVQADLKDGLNQVPGRPKLEIHHTVPYADPDAEKARELLRKWGLSIHDPADAAIVPYTYHRGENIHGMADGGYNTMVIARLQAADLKAMAEAEAGDRKAGRIVMLEAIRELSDELVEGSLDPRAIVLERMLRTVERPVPPPDLASPYDGEGYGP